MSNKKQKNFVVPTEENVEEVVEVVTEDTEMVTEEVVETVEEVEEVVYEPVAPVGTVTGCTSLNVRRKPIVDADVIAIIERNTKVVVIDAESNNDFYNVRLEDGVEGFCMKKYIHI